MNCSTHIQLSELIEAIQSDLDVSFNDYTTFLAVRLTPTKAKKVARIGGNNATKAINLGSLSLTWRETVEVRGVSVT